MNRRIGQAAAIHARYAILGSVELCDGARRLAVGGPRQVALLALLLVNANRALSSDSMIDALWPDRGGAGARKRLQVAVLRLRRTLDDGGLDAESVLRTVAGGYLLQVKPGELDAELFDSRAQEGRRALERGDAHTARGVLREALAFWRGPALADVAYEEFAQAEIRRLDALRLSALEARIDADLRLGEHGSLVVELDALTGAHPERERFAAQLMLALYRCGRQSEALEAYARARAHLATELGLEPGPALQALQREILEQAPSLDLERSSAPGPSRVATPRSASAPLALPAPLAGHAGDAFVGRDADLRKLQDGLERAARGTRQIVLVSGEPGIGKTRLATQCALRARDAGAIVLYGRCDEEALLSQQPFAEALRRYVRACPPDELVGQLQLVSGELRRILPELGELVPGLPEPLAGDPEGARSRLFEAISSLLCEAAQKTPVLLVLDDLHWADRATLLLLKYLARYPRQARLMVLGTYRETELDVDHPLPATLAELGRERLAERHALARLDATAVAELVALHAGDAASAELGQLVYDETDGNAFFVVEVVRHLVESGVVDSTGANQRSPLAAGRLVAPEGVRDVIGQRLARLGRDTHRLLTTASVLGRVFEFDVLQRLSELGEDELVDALESAIRARVIEELPGRAGRYTFSHALIRDTLYGALTGTRCALLHRRAGIALEAAHGAAPEPFLAELAHHFALAGAGGDIAKAIEYGARAAEHATSLLAYEQAAAHLRQTVELIDRMDPQRLQRERCDLTIAQGEAERQAGDPAYRQTLLDAARGAQKLGDPERLARAALANNRGFASSAEGVDLDRVAVLRAALDAYDPGDSSVQAGLLALLALELVADDDWRQREQISDEALAMAKRVGDPQTLGLVLTQHCMAQWTPEKVPVLRANLQQAAQLAEHCADPLLAGHIAYHAADAAMELGDLEDADRQASRLAAVAEQLGQPFMRWWQVVARGKWLLISGPPEEAERVAFAGMQLGEEAGQPDALLWFLGQLFAARFLQGALDESEPHLPTLFDAGSAPPIAPELAPGRSIPLLIAAATSAAMCETGRLDEAREHFDPLIAALDELPHDYTALAIPAFATVACARLGDIAAAERLHTLLEPHADRLVNTGSAWFGAVAHHLGLLAATLGHFKEAQSHFAAAEQRYTSLGAAPWLARLRADRAAAIVIR